MTTTTQKLADALRYVLAGDVVTNGCRRRAREALAAYDAQKAETLTIRVNGEAARMALCDCLKGWHARRDGTWHVITTHANRSHMLALINDLGIRAKVMP